MANPISSTIIVGGGLAGIAAALALARRGVSVTLLESRQRLGGRAGSFAIRDSRGAEVDTVDYCQHVGMGCCSNLLKLIDWLGQRGDWREHRELHFFGPHGDYQRLGSLPLLPAPLHLSGWLLKWPHLQPADRLSVARGMLAIRRLRRDQPTQSQTALAWLEAIGQTPRAIEHFWSTIIVSALGEELTRVSLAAVAQVLQDGFLNHRDAFHLLVPQQPLGELFGTRAVERLTQLGVEVQLSTPVSKLTQLPTRHIQLETRTRTWLADSVILAVPWHQLTKLEWGGDLKKLEIITCDAQKLHSSPITGVHTWWDRPWLHLPHAALVGRLCQWVFPKPNASPQSASATGTQSAAPVHSFYYQIVISASRNLRAVDSREIAGLVHADLAAVFPSVRQARLLSCRAVTDPQAVFSITPESYRLRPAGLVQERIALAGDWTQTGWPATMEGAILSGFTAAEQLSGP